MNVEEKGRNKKRSVEEQGASKGGGRLLTVEQACGKARRGNEEKGEGANTWKGRR